MRKLLLALVLVFLQLGAIAQDNYERKVAFCKQIITNKKASITELKQLRILLQDDDYLIRKQAANALSGTKDTSTETLMALTKNLDAITDTLKWDLNFTDTKDEVTRASAALALLNLGEKGKTILKQRAFKGAAVRAKAEAIMALRSSADAKDTIGLGAEMSKLYGGIHTVLNPSPTVSVNSFIKDPAFKSKLVTTEWNVVKSTAKGKITFDTQSRTVGSGSLKVVKETDEGELYVRSKKMTNLTAAKNFLVRLYFRADDIATNSTFQIVFEDKDGNITVGDDKYSGEAQTFMRNLAPGKWSKRFAIFAPKTTDDYYIGFVFRGNAGTIYVDDVTAPATNVSLNFFPVESQFKDFNSALLSNKAELSQAALQKQDDRVRLTLNNKAVVPAMHHVLGPSGQFAEYALMESLGGINIQVVSLDMLTRGKEFTDHPTWPAVGVYNFSETFKRLEYALANAPQTQIILNINTSWPPDWIVQNPDHTWQNIKGQRGYGMTSQQLFMGFADELPGPNYKWWPSPFSEKAIFDAQEVVSAFVKELKTKPYANKVIGCHISGGHDGQFNTSGRPCYSPISKQAFKTWLKNLYHTDDELKKRWNNKDVTLATAEIPDYTKRSTSSGGLFYNPQTDQPFIDHTRFQSEQGMIIRDRIAEAFKKYMETPVIGMTWVMGGGRGQGVQNIFFNSKNLDILVGQPTYARRLPGYIGGMRNVAINSYKEHGKMLFKEFDFRTWTRNSTDELYAQRLSSTEAADDFRAAFRKEFMQMFGQGMGFWMYDIGRNHFKDPGMLAAVKEGVNLYQNYELNAEQLDTQRDVAIVFVDESLQWEKRAINTNNGLTLDGHTYFNVAEAGFTFDSYYLSDILNNPKLQKHKLYIFKDAWKLSAAQRAEIQEKLQKGGKVLVWNYAVGYIGDDQFSDQYVSELTKMEVTSKLIDDWPELKPVNHPLYMDKVNGRIGTLNAIGAAMARGGSSPKSAINIHRFEINAAKDVVPLALYEDGKIAIAAKELPNWTSVHFGLLGSLDARILNNLARKAGAHCFMDAGLGSVDFNGNLLGIHFIKNEKNVNIELPFKSKVIDFDTKKVLLEAGRNFTINANAGDSKFFVVEMLK